MPISEDEYDYNIPQEPQSTMSKAELRKTHKPIMEKRRRARINQCLNEIKSLILEAMNKDPARHSKLEKADILEMAVKHLQNVQRQQLALAMATDPTVLRKFKTGFNECTSEIERYMNQVDGVDNAMKQRVATHLQKCIGGIEHVAQLNFPGFSNLPFLTGSGVFTSAQTPIEASANAGDQNNNPRIQIPQGIQLIPSRLPSGELALLVPNSSNLPYFPTAVTQNVQRPSAFAAVVPQSATAESLVSKPASPPVSPVTKDDPRLGSLSPRGFRPVVSNKQRGYNDDHQVPSDIFYGVLRKTSVFSAVRGEKDGIPKKSVEPLCIITNQSERYKQAQMKVDSANYEENIMYQGIKRKHQDNQGLLAIAHPDFGYVLPPKKIKTAYPTIDLVGEEESTSNPSKSTDFVRSMPTTEASQKEEGKKKEDLPSGSKDNSCEGNCDMWRPW
ncbi:hypothetical protein NQ318_005527 [Aromia moschata]|uniref:Protein deadpan n=1 Tax=Aromia moschata TaxID=1265417 RepID=A0AAV8Y4H9_9CUCU|nr:hypothetical protein NQ318_005527 [Aromia moschata]